MDVPAEDIADEAAPVGEPAEASPEVDAAPEAEVDAAPEAAADHDDVDQAELDDDAAAEDGLADDGLDQDGPDEAVAPGGPAARRGSLLRRLPLPLRRLPLRRRSSRPRLPGRDPVWARVAIAFGLVLVVLSGAAIGGSRVLAARYDNAVNKDTLLAPEARVTDAPAQRHSTILGPLNYLLIGSDLRATDPEDGQRSDTVIILHIPASLDRAYLLSVPRDLRVHIPAFPPTGFTGSTAKINGAFQGGGGGAGGVQLLSQTLTSLMGIRFDGAAIIDFDGFQAVVRQLGGVDMCIDVRTESHHIGYDKNGNFLAPWDGPDGSHRNRNSTPVVYLPGCQHLAAWQALDFVRQRKSLPDGDYGRQRHQQQFLRAVFDRAKKQNLTSNPIALDHLIRAVGNSLTVDTNGVSLDELMFGLRNVSPSDLTGLQLPSVPQDIGGISYVVAKPEAAGLYAALRDDTMSSWVGDNPSWVNHI